jgi:LAGLIDADG DNA endonuclease family protein
MFNKDKRSLLLSLVLGDGCLHYIRNAGNLYGGLTIDHGMDQADYQSWKASLLSTIMDKPVKMRQGHKGKSVQVSICMKRLRAWRKFCYPNGKKDISKILRFINHPEFALAVWLMDDGYVEPNGDGLKSRLRIFTCDQTLETQTKIIEWFKVNFNVEPTVAYQKSAKQSKSYPFLKLNHTDSLKLWAIIRGWVLEFKSMQYKFRNMEKAYQA